MFIIFQQKYEAFKNVKSLYDKNIIENYPTTTAELHFVHEAYNSFLYAPQNTITYLITHSKHAR